MSDIVALVEPVIPALRRYARALVRDRAAADDLVHDCLERALRGWHQRRADGNVRTWLFAILHNLACNRLRQASRRGAHVELDGADPALALPAVQEDHVRHRDLVRALAQLGDDQRSVVLLIGVEDLSYADAATVLGVPIGTVMSRLSRARERLRALMQDAPAQPIALRKVP